jgi:hypothetical protein
LAIAGSGVEVSDMTQFASDQKMITCTDRRGDWKFDILDIPKEGERELARRFTQAYNEPVDVRMQLITITTLHSSKAPLEDRENDLDKWQQATANYLNGKGLRKLTPADFANSSFQDTDALRDLIAQNLPYGNRSMRLGPPIMVLANDRDNDCLKLAWGFVLEPEQDVKNDHGGMGLYDFTIGSCRREGVLVMGWMRSFIRELRP